MTKSEYKALLEEAFDTGYEDAKLDLFMESCGITEDYITETNEIGEEWLDTFEEAAMPSPKELAVKIYERVLKSAKVAKAFAKNPDKVEIMKKSIKRMAAVAAKTVDDACKANKDTSKEIVKEVGLGVICSLIIAVIAGVGPVATVATITGATVLLNKAIKMVVEDKDVRKAFKFVKEGIGKIVEKVTPKKESTEVEEVPSFDLEADMGKFSEK